MLGGAPVGAVGSSASYEPFGPLSGLTFGTGVVAAFTYDQDYELTGIAAANGAAHIQSLTNGYDPAGNITSITDALATPRSQTLAYDNLTGLTPPSGTGRNASAALNATTVGSYLYNAFEKRVQKTASGVTTQQIFDRFGHLLEDANASGVAQTEYIWLDDV